MMPNTSQRNLQFRIAILIIVLGIALRLPLIFLPLNYMADPWRPTDTASIAHNFVDNGFHLFYPQINWRGAGPGYVETEFQLYSFIVAVLYRVFGEQAWLGRLVSLGFSVMALFIFYLLANRLFKSTIALWALAFFVVSPLYIVYSVEFMPEATVLFFYIAALYLFQRWLDKQQFVILLLAAVSTSLAILVKPTSIHIGFIFLLLLLERFRLRAFTKWQVWVFGAICLVPSLIWYLHARELYLETGNTFGVISGGDSKFGNLLSYWFSPQFYLSLLRLDIKWVFSGVSIVVFLLGVFLCVRKRAPSLMLFGLIAIVIYYLIVPRYTIFAEYYHLYFVPFAALGVGVGLDWLFGQAKELLRERKAVQYLPVLAGVVTIIFTLGFTVLFYRGLFTPQDQQLVDCAKSVSMFVPKDALVVISTTSASNDAGVPNNYQEPIIFYFSQRYGWSLPADQHTPNQILQFYKEGAKYFVIYSGELYNANPALAQFLETSTQQIGPGIEAGCGIYKLDNSF